MSNELDPIDKAAKALRQARDKLTERATFLHDQIEAAKRASMRGLRNSVGEVAEAQAALVAAIEGAPDLFIRPKSIVLHGVKLGYQKGKGKIDWEDDAQVVKLIRKHLPENFDVLVKTTEEPVRGALANLTVAELKKIGITVEGTGDVVFARDTTATVDKLVKAFLKGADEEAAS